MQRRDFLGAVTLASIGVATLSRKALAGSSLPVEPGAAMPLMTVYKTPTCGCCKEWIKYMQGAGFALKAVDMNDLSQVKRDAGVPAEMESCHTALIGAYVVEGHVPADLVKKMLAEKPKIIGLSVPGMVNGPPGMEDGPKQPYTVMAFAKTGKATVYARR